MTPSDESPYDLAVRGRILSCRADPFFSRPQDALLYIEDGVVLIKNGVILACGPASDYVLYPKTTVSYDRDRLILPGFVDCHLHFPQTLMTASYGEGLLTWLEKYAFPCEAEYGSSAVAAATARIFFDLLIGAGVTTAAAFGSVHETGVDALFTEAEARNFRLFAGKVWMDRNAPANLLDTPQSAYDASVRLINKWHGRARLGYAVTPRFAPTSSEEQLELAGDLFQSRAGLLMQSHVSENLAEIDWVKKLFPSCASYTEVYAKYDLLGPRSVLGHGVHLDESEWEILYDRGASIAHCPSSNAFLGSGAFRIDQAKKPGRAVGVGLGSDIGAGTSFSPWRTMSYAYEAARSHGVALSPLKIFYLATLGGAKALRVDDRVGSLERGKDADLVIINLNSTPLAAARTARAENIEDIIFAMTILSDERSVEEVFLAGKSTRRRSDRPAAEKAPSGKERPYEK